MMNKKNNNPQVTTHNSPLVKAGYKQTEIGLIPEDWDIKNIGFCAEVVGGGTPSTFNLKYWKGNINWFTPTEVGLKKYLDESSRKITEEGILNCSAKMLPIGTILLTSRAGIGDLGILTKESCTNQGFQSLIPKENSDGEFLYYLIGSLKNVLLKNASGSTFLEISPGKIKSILIPFPPTKAEQTAIATALNDVDELISTTETLIAKKKAIKQGAMQELLKPKEWWVEKNLGEVLDVHYGKSQKEVEDENGIYPILASGGIIGKANDYLYDKPSVLIGRKGTIDVPQYMDTPFWTVDTLFYTEIFPNNNAKFIYFMFKLIDWYAYNEASGVPSLNAKSIKSIKKYFPLNPSEQTRIAQILSDMDTEIEALEQKLEKQKQIKQGMMQMLLTGKVRLL
jgi:type I restriction enzyme S subunit